MTAPGRIVAGVELGGTKIVCGIASADQPSAVLDSIRFPTGDPAGTLGRIDEFVRGADERWVVEAVGVASFGPVNVDPTAERYAWITDTPKHGWVDTSILDGIPSSRSRPVVVMSDVSAAALAEHRLGAAAGTRNAAYITVGTGIGAGLIVHGELLHGNGFPEAGHLIVRRHPADDFAGSCPLHGDCAEGLASGPAVRARWGRGGEELTAEQLPEAREVLGSYIAQVAHAVRGIAGSECIVLGGGVMEMPGLIEAVEVQLQALRRAPVAEDAAARGPVLRRPAFADAGLVGALAAAAGLVS